ncbi:unnamed protein product, partial [Mesorhabditis belari]|uniref:Uncharacterized protein n=1 Tax=Mesorhabditis belari TaxID=2138241 RepID=A0AAF3J5I4_9BILA
MSVSISSTSQRSCPKCLTSFCEKCGYHGYENIYERASFYESRSSHFSSPSQAPSFLRPIVAPPSQCPLHSCKLQETCWPKMRQMEKLFLFTFSTTFLVCSIVEWGFFNLPTLGSHLSTGFKVDAHSLLRTFFDNGIPVYYSFLWLLGVFSIQCKSWRCLLAVIGILLLFSVLQALHLLFHLLGDHYWQGMVLLLGIDLSMIAILFLVKKHYHYMRLFHEVTSSIACQG